MKTINKILSLSLFLIIASCGGKTGNKTSNNSVDSESTEIAGKTSNDLAESRGIKKLNLLIEVYNSFSSPSYKSYDSYVQSFGDNPEKFKKIRKWYGGENVSSYDIKKIKTLEQATKINIYDELNPIILEYKKSAESLTKVLNQSFSYYDMKDYKSDNFAKAKEFHKPTLNAYNTFFLIDNVLREKTDSIQNELEIVRLNKLKKEGETLQYLVGMAMNTSAKVLNVTQSKAYKNIDISELENTHKEARKTFDELTQFKTDKPDEFNADHGMTRFYSSFRDFVKASKSLVDRKKENRPFSRGERMNLNPSTGWMVHGSTYQVLKKYNTLIDNYNRLID